MTITLDYSSDSLRAAGLSGAELSSARAASEALTAEIVLQRYWATVWAAPGGMLEEAFCRTVSGFVRSCRRDVEEYLDRRQTFEAITRRFIGKLPALGLPAGDPAIYLNELGLGAAAVQSEVEFALADCWQPRESISILGYGADTCRFEHDLGGYAVAQGWSGGYRVYRHDPFAPPSPEIVDLTVADLCSPPAQGVDLVTARWVLHHVERGDRWSTLAACLAWLGDGGHCVFVEQGDFADRDDSRLENRLYRFLLMANDVLANYALRPSWFTHTAPDFGADFHVDYLDAFDLRAIESSFRRPVRRSVHPVRSGARSGETVIIYHLDH